MAIFQTPTIKRLINELLHEEGFRQLLGRELTDLVREDYLIKSTGQKDAFGTKWEPTQSDNPIGIRTGDLLHSITFETTPDGIRIFVDPNITYATFFDARRPIFPPELTNRRGVIPQRWRQVITRAIIDYLSTHLPQRMNALGLRAHTRKS